MHLCLLLVLFLPPYYGGVATHGASAAKPKQKIMHWLPVVLVASTGRAAVADYVQVLGRSPEGSQDRPGIKLAWLTPAFSRLANRKWEAI